MDILQFLQDHAHVLTILASVAGILTLVFTIYKATHGAHIRYLSNRIADLEKSIETADSPALVERLQHDLHQSETTIGSLKSQLDSAADQSAAAKLDWDQTTTQKNDTIQSLTTALEHEKELATKLEKATQSRANLVHKVFKLEGRLWQQKALHGIPKFQPLHDRRTAILSVLNLKGGVGKTTITANLAAAFHQKGYRVLVVDLDLQGSLSSLFLTESDIAARHHEPS
jgi:Flp pilus assembly CpaE family ATPase